MKKTLWMFLVGFVVLYYFLLHIDEEDSQNNIIKEHMNNSNISVNHNQEHNLKNRFMLSLDKLNSNYSINYVLNGGVNPSNAATTYKFYEEVMLPIPTKENNNFLGWYTDSEYTNKVTKIDVGNEINYNLYAKWEFNAKRDYNYLYYVNSDNYIVKNQDDIKNSIYNGLNDGGKKITLYCDYGDYNNCLNDFHLVYKDSFLMSSITNYVSPYNRYSSMKYRININNNSAKIELSIEKKYTEEQISEIEKKIDKYLNKLDLEKMTDMQKIKWAHDFIVNRNKYDEDATKKGSGNAYSAYGAIVGNKATCQGYAEAMAILLDRFGIPNIMISNGIHIWNLINVNDEWLHLDATWDDPIFSSGKQEIIYDYYLVTSKELFKLDSSKDHKYDSDYYLESLLN